jgi:sensor domain CHASE-containing protein/nitrogen-specific signal transduction histidine kinase
VHLHAARVYAFTAVLAVALALASWQVERINDQRYQSRIRAETQAQLVEVRDRLESSLIGDVQLVQGLISVIAVDPTIDQKRFERAARPLFNTRTHLRNIGGAPDMVIHLMYPLSGNEKAIGLDYRKTPAQFAAAEQARLARQVVLAGPLKLAQGGTGLIARLPIYLEPEAGKEEFWGLVSAVIDVERLYQTSHLSDPDSPLEIAIRGRDGKGAEGEVFFGSAELFSRDAILTSIQLPSGSWQLAAVPRQGWPAHADNLWLLRAAFILIATLVLGSFLALGRALQQAAAARQRAEELQKLAEAASEAKSRFLATMSHEIRTPLNGILGMAQLLLMPGNDDSEVRDYARTINNSGQTLLALLNDILDAAKIEAGRVELNHGTFAPPQVLHDVHSLFRELAEAKGLQLEETLLPSLQAAYHGDALRLRQMLSNLVANAIKFTERGFVRIDCGEVSAANDSAMLEFGVSDSGVGLTPEQQAQLFKPFSQADSSTTREYGGTGLGLSIVRDLARLHGGEAGVESVHGQGSRFWFRVQVATIAPGEDRRAVAR